VTLISQAVLAAKTADVVIVLSSEDAEYLTGRLHVPSRRVIIAPSGVDSRFLATTKVVREDDEIRLIFVGSWIDRKGTPELGAAWEALGDDPRLRLTLAGTSAGVVEVLASLPRIYRDRVVVVPVLDQDAMCELLAAHDLFVLPSWFEGMPITLLEAAATGLPCVACSICGNRDVFPEEQAEDFGAIMIPPHRSDALIEALAILIADPARRDELGRRARRRASLFSWEASAEQIASAYSIACGTEVPSSK
jgi:glycosyltransferase involved in cell wall biosynthesis